MARTFTGTKGVLTLDRLQAYAPSIFQSSAKDGLSDRYTFIPTIEIVRQMENQGWLPVLATESRVRNELNQGYQKHMVRFRNFCEKVTDVLNVGDSFIEMVLTNSHNGQSSFIFNVGLFRLACSNGMVVSEGSFDTAHIRHNSYEAQNVVDICAQVVDKAPMIGGTVMDMKAIDLAPQEQRIFADAANPLRFEKPEQVETDRVLQPRRSSDHGTSLWKTLNVLQENLVKGQVRYNRFDSEGRYAGRGRTREVKSIDGSIKLNQALWMLAEKMKELKQEQSA